MVIVYKILPIISNVGKNVDDTVVTIGHIKAAVAVLGQKDFSFVENGKGPVDNGLTTDAESIDTNTRGHCHVAR